MARFGVLLCTDAASEGLNLQTASALVNYDLPWNPSKVEQRIGRIGRIGQTEPVVRVRQSLPPRAASTTTSTVAAHAVRVVPAFRRPDAARTCQGTKDAARPRGA